MSELISKLTIVNSGKTIFDTEMAYSIPLYQRAFAWEDKQLTQLLEDLSDVPEGANYYLGTLIVSSSSGKYEVVDGQQRLTALYLLLNCLGLKVQNKLSFACREKSNYTLSNIKSIIESVVNKRFRDEENRTEPGIINGLKIILEELGKPEFNKEQLLKNLERVVLYRIEVPENTDLNRYFEIMNTRGEQLEQHDILKAALMSYLPEESEKAIFAKIWDACSDMTGYVQMHFVSKNNSLREFLFGIGWHDLPPADWNQYLSGMKTISDDGTNHTITDIIDINFEVDTDDGYIDDETRVRFESVIEFPFFLIHTLKVLIGAKNIRHEDNSSAIIAELLDDKKLVDTFNRVITFGITDSGRIIEDKAQFSRDFIICLLRTRFLFDEYIVKREYANDNSDGEWSMKSLYVSGQQSKKRPYYRNSRFTKAGEWYTTNDYRTKTNIMIQSALRVSYTSPKVMHWITELLKWLYSEANAHAVNTSEEMGHYVADYSKIAEDIAKRAVKENFFAVCKDGIYAMGVNTPHIVFNYLDFLLWSEKPGKYGDFVFEFRNSVEHWYPRNPSEGTFEQWTDGVDRFGNLCLIQRNVNSRFSNMSPEAKNSTFTQMIEKGSLKLQCMSKLTEKNGEKSASICWKDTLCKKHEEAMLAKLRAACGINEPGEIQAAQV